MYQFPNTTVYNSPFLALYPHLLLLLGRTSVFHLIMMLCLLYVSVCQFAVSLVAET